MEDWQLKQDLFGATDLQFQNGFRLGVMRALHWAASRVDAEKQNLYDGPTVKLAGGLAAEVRSKFWQDVI